MVPYHSVLLALSFVFPALVYDITYAIDEALAASSSSECCDTCIGKTSTVPYNYDPLIFSQCTEVTGGICCFDCGNLGDPIYGDAVSYRDDGVTAVVKAGNYISFTWSGVENVTSAGVIYFRGWGSDSCREASPEQSVTIEAGNSSSATCDVSDVQLTTTSSSDFASSGSSLVATDATVASCNQQRASVQVVDGIEHCVCVSDWSNPPECDRWPLWKWLVTIGGAVAALFSIIISLRALLAGHKKKKEEKEYRESVARVTPKSAVATLEATRDCNYQVNAGLPSKCDSQGDRTAGVPRNTAGHELTL
ncbi:unnamed protein product [Peronospora belbahrii]|uniref:Ig-like domain-containing protein n=1 Tax=Peronospora belbahrii TaxID=622444 RepID=A0ABN8D4Z5_9STRA|nr:unnamed protein product [Peronospora belbahrii]